MNHPVLASLLPVMLLIAVGWFAGRRGWMGPAAVKDLSNLVFLVFTPALLFRTMSTAPIEAVEPRPVVAYFAAAAVLFGGTLLWHGFNRRAAVLALASCFSNTVMIGIPLVSLAYGQQGLVPLLALVSLHSLVIVTLATVVLEVSVIRERAAQPDAPPRRMVSTALLAIRNSVIHPVPLPILAGLAFAALGWTLPPVIDRPLLWMGQAFGPLALVLCGVTLAATPIGTHWKGALGLAIAKNLLHPLLVLGFCWALGVTGLPMVVMAVAAALPVGANVFMFSQRYEVAQDLVTSAVAVSTVLAIATVSAVMVLGR